MAEKKKRGRPKKVKAGDGKLFGDDREEIIPEIDQKAATYDAAMRARLPLSKREKEAKTSLIETMVANGKHRYRMKDGSVVDLTDSHNIRITKPSENGDGGE